MRSRRHSHLAQLALALALGATAAVASEATDAAGKTSAPGATQPAAGPATPAAPAPSTEAAAPAASVPAKPVVPKPRPRLSPQLAAQVSTQLPVWTPPPPAKADQPPAPPPPADPDVVQMKPVTVFADKLPRIDEQEWLTPKAWDGVLVKKYLSDFDRDFLNRYTLPIIGISPEARARMMYEENKRLQDLKSMNDQIDQLQKTDPEAAQELQQIRDQIFTRTGE